MHRRLRLGLAPAMLLFIWLSSTAQAAPRVVVSLKPVHSLVAGLMQGVDAPQLLLEENQSPHQMSLKPSQLRLLEHADLIVWIGARLEPALAHLLDQRRDDSRIVELVKVPGIHLLPVRDRRAWHSHAEHDHATAGAQGETVDHHIWLSPENAAQVVTHLSEMLKQLDPENRQIYETNKENLLARLQHLEQKIRSELEPVRHLPYIVFHDAYQYFEAYFGLDAIGSVSIDPDQLSGARHVLRLRETIKRAQARCLFTEPQFEPKLARALVEDTAANTGQLDPLGNQLPAGPDSYFSLLQALADNLRDCLSKEHKE